MDSLTLQILSGTITGALIASVSFAIAYRLGKRHGRAQAAEAGRRLNARAVTSYRLADGSVPQYSLADRTIKPD